MIRAVSCPHQECGEPFHVTPFQDSVLVTCPWCEGILVVSAEGEFWMTSELRTSRPINGNWALGFHTTAPVRP